MEAVNAIAERLFGATLATMDLLSVALGDRLGFYRCLAQAAPAGLSATELGAATGTEARYVREWLEQQAVTGLLETLEPEGPVHRADPGVVPGGDPAPCRRFALAAGVGEVLTDEDSLVFLAPLARQLAAAARALPAVADAARHGGGVPWAGYGTDMCESEADLNRPGYLQLLADQWLAAMPDVAARLRADPPARVADVGCGGGWSAIGLARGFPRTRVDAYDLDPASVALARANVAAAGLADRVQVHEGDIALAPAGDGCALVTAFECLHDLPYPVAALVAMRRLAGPEGAVLVGDMKVADRFTAPGDDVERLMYGFSVLVCLPDSLSTPGSVATGAAMRTDTLRGYAAAAGYRSVEVLPIEHDLWRFYRLHPSS